MTDQTHAPLPWYRRLTLAIQRAVLSYVLGLATGESQSAVARDRQNR
jgi:hypothetical protein